MDINGFSEAVALGIDDYDEVLGEIYEKYKNVNRRIEPELKLVLMVGASAASFSASKSMLKRNPTDTYTEDQLPRDPQYVNKIGKQFVNTLESKTSQNQTEDDIEKKKCMNKRNPLKRLSKKKYNV